MWCHVRIEVTNNNNSIISKGNTVYNLTQSGMHCLLTDPWGGGRGQVHIENV